MGGRGFRIYGIGLDVFLGFGLDVFPLGMWDSGDILGILWGYYVGFWGYYVGFWGYSGDFMWDSGDIMWRII